MDAIREQIRASNVVIAVSMTIKWRIKLMRGC